MLKDEKTALRRPLLAARAALSPAEREERDRWVCRSLLESDIFDSAPLVLLYAAVRGEIDLSPVAEALTERGVALAYPITERGGIMHFRIAKPSELIPGGYGIPEPPPTAPLAVPDGRTVCLVPALAFDAEGYRIGYGGGYYDRFLRGFSGVTVGIADRISQTPLPRDIYDLPVGRIADRTGIHQVHPTSEVNL